MSKKWILTVATAYVAGVAAATFYWKNSKQLRKDLEKAEEEGTSKFQVVIWAFLDTHSNMINSLKEEIMCERNIKLYHEYMDEAWKKLKELYNSKVFDLENIKWISSKALEELKDKLSRIFYFTKSEIEKEVEESKKEKKHKKK